MASSTATKSFHQTMLGIAKRIPGGSLIFAVVPLVVLSYVGWLVYGADHLDQAQYALRLENILATSQPEWIDANLTEDVFVDSGLDRISLLDPEANRLIARAFEAHVCVKSTHSVSTGQGGKVNVELIYRRPIALVKFDIADAPEGKLTSGFYPLDEDGTILPTDGFSENDVENYLVIMSPNPRPYAQLGFEGRSFGDPAVSAALELCGLLETRRERMGLERIYIQKESNPGSPSPWQFTLTARSGDQIVLWGHAPSGELAGEPNADEKLSRLNSWILSKPGSNAKIDLRTTTPVQPVKATLPQISNSAQF